MHSRTWSNECSAECSSALCVVLAMAITSRKRLDTAGVAGSPENPHERAQHMLVGTIPVPAVVVAAVDVIAVMMRALASAWFLGDRSQGRIVSVPKELTEEGNIVRLSEGLRVASAAAKLARIGEPSLSHFAPHSTGRGERNAVLFQCCLLYTSDAADE